jgi:hypothetical protein
LIRLRWTLFVPLLLSPMRILAKTAILETFGHLLRFYGSDVIQPIGCRFSATL